MKVCPPFLLVAQYSFSLFTVVPKFIGLSSDHQLRITLYAVVTHSPSLDHSRKLPNAFPINILCQPDSTPPDAPRRKAWQTHRITSPPVCLIEYVYVWD